MGLHARRSGAHALWREQPGLHRGYLVDVITAIVISLALILGGRARTVAVAWGTLNENGGPMLWGCVFAGTAALLIVCSFISPLAMWLALWIAALPYALLGWWFLHTAIFLEPSASFCGAIMFLRGAFMHLSRAEAWRVGPKHDSEADQAGRRS